MTSKTQAVKKPPVLLRWGLPRDHRAMEHVLVFVLVGMATILVTRMFLIATGYPQLGGDGLHIAHVLWGGALLIVAVLAQLMFIGPVVRPAVAFIGGVGFGLFIDEVGKFLTEDNNYFYAPAFAIMYASGVSLVVLADFVASRRRRSDGEDLASAVDIAVSGVVGGLSVRQRTAALDLIARGEGASGSAEARELINAIHDDEDELPDPLRALSARLGNRLRHLVSTRDAWRIALVSSGVVLTASTLVALTDITQAIDNGVAYFVVAAGLSLIAAWALWAGGVLVRRRDGSGARRRAIDLLRAAIAVNLLLTQVALFRFDPWQATILVIAGLVTLAVLWAEQHVSDQKDSVSSAPA